jgi:nucleoside-diphosphate-sugar epimerase
MHRDFTYIDDIVDGIWKTINYVIEEEYCKQLPYDIFNIGRGQTRELI